MSTKWHYKQQNWEEYNHPRKFDVSEPVSNVTKSVACMVQRQCLVAGAHHPPNHNSIQPVKTATTSNNSNNQQTLFRILINPTSELALMAHFSALIDLSFLSDQIRDHHGTRKIVPPSLEHNVTIRSRISYCWFVPPCQLLVSVKFFPQSAVT